jgi:hypothetical protein
MITMVLSAAPSASAQVTGTRTNVRQTETLLIRIETKIDILKEEAQRFANRNTNTGTGTSDQFTDYLSTLEQSVIKLHETLDNRAPLTEDLRDALTNATMIDQFLVRNRVTASAQSQWRSLKRDFTTLATSNRVSWNWNQPITPVNVPVETGYPSTGTHTASVSQVRTLLSRLELKTNNYKRQMETALKADTAADQSDDAIAEYVADFETAELRLKQRFEARQSTTADATEVLTRATYIDQFMSRNRLNAQTQAQWRNLKADLNTLATYYTINWDWNQTIPSNTGSSGGGVNLRNFDARLTGTYRLNASLSENTTAAIDQALGATPAAERENYRRRLEQRLSSPEVIAIEKTGPTVTLASSILPQVTFQADGVARSETNARGRTVTTTATADQDGLIINYQGERSSDFYITFLPIAERRLKMTRRIYLDNGSNSITVSSIYDKLDNVARWNAVNNPINETGGVSTTVNDSFVVPTGTRLSAELRSSIRGSEAGERFTMEVTTPVQYRGAIIGGRVISEDAAGRVAGRSRVLLVFDTIRLPGGQTHRFTGSIDAVTAANGDSIGVTNQTARTAAQPTRGVGGVLGALIGAISGVPVDASNSAATAGSILTQNRDIIDIDAGSQFLITASATGVVTAPR